MGTPRQPWGCTRNALPARSGSQTAAGSSATAHARRRLAPGRSPWPSITAASPAALRSRMAGHLMTSDVG